MEAIQSLENPSEEDMYKLVRDGYINTYGEEYLYNMVENYLLLCMITKPSFDYPKDVKLTSYKTKASTLERLKLDL